MSRKCQKVAYYRNKGAVESSLEGRITPNLLNFSYPCTREGLHRIWRYPPLTAPSWVYTL